MGRGRSESKSMRMDGSRRGARVSAAGGVGGAGKVRSEVDEKGWIEEGGERQRGGRDEGADKGAHHRAKNDGDEGNGPTEVGPYFFVAVQLEPCIVLPLTRAVCWAPSTVNVS